MAFASLLESHKFLLILQGRLGYTYPPRAHRARLLGRWQHPAGRSVGCLRARRKDFGQAGYPELGSVRCAMP
jgi:hypothetical protein